jgi:hypothetical protein
LLQNAKDELKKIIKLAGELQEELYQTSNCSAAYLGLSQLSRYALDADETLFQLRSILMEARHGN